MFSFLFMFNYFTTFCSDIFSLIIKDKDNYGQISKSKGAGACHLLQTPSSTVLSNVLSNNFDFQIQIVLISKRILGALYAFILHVMLFMSEEET